MQEDAAAFEGWAFVIYTYYAKKKGLYVQLGLSEKAEEGARRFTEMDFPNNGKANERKI